MIATIVVVLLVSIYMLVLLTLYIVKKIRHEKIDTCGCKSTKGKKELLKYYYSQKKKENCSKCNLEK